MTARAARYWRDVGVMLGGNALAQALPVLASLVLARLLAPVAFGQYAAWLGVVMLAAVALTARIEVAIPMEGEEEGKQAAVRAGLVVIVTLGCCAGLVVFVASMSGLGVAPKLLVAGGAAACLTAASQLWQMWLAAKGMYAELSRVRVAQAVVLSLAQIILASIEADAWALVMGYLCGVLVGLGWAIHLLPLGGDVGHVCSAPRAAWIYLRGRYRFPLYALPADLTSSLTAQLPVLLASARFGAEVAGCLALALRVLGAPISLLGAAVLDVFRRESASAWRERGECREAYDRTLKVLGVASLVFLLLLTPIIEPLFILAFGDTWQLSGEMALWLLPLFALRFVASPLSYLFYVAEHQSADLIWQLVLLALVTLSFVWPARHGQAILAYSLAYSGMYALYLAISFRLSRGMSR